MSSETPPFAYDAVAYPALAHPNSHPAQLAPKATLLGLSPAPPERCRVLELGCGDGANLAAMAALYPNSEYVGVDLSSAAIARGQAFLAEAGITSVQLHPVSLTEINASWGTFDYIIAHGVYSWVPAPVREAVLRVAGTLLAPDGVAFISYLALPGAHLRDLVRTLARFHTENTADPDRKVRDGISMVGFVGRAGTENSLYQQMLREEFEKLRTRNPQEFFHDELSDTSAPFLFRDFCRDAGLHGLHFLTDAEYVEAPAFALTPEAEQALRPLQSDRILQEQYYDFIHGRRFRQTLLCRVRPEGTVRKDRLTSMHLACAATPQGDPGVLNSPEPMVFQGRKRSSFRCDHALSKAVLYELASIYPETLPYEAALIRGRDRLGQSEPVSPADEAKLRSYLVRLYSPSLIELYCGPLPCPTRAGERPVASALARCQASRGEPSLLNLAGRGVVVDEPLLRAILLLLDGTHTRDDIRRELMAMMATAGSEQGERPAESPDPDAVAREIDRALHQFARNLLLSA